MAQRKRPTRKRNQEKKPALAQASEVIAIVLLGLGFLHFLALASFDAYDLPTWVKLHKVSTPNDPVLNFIGPVGAILAGYSFFFLGVAAYLIPTGLIWFGVSKLTSQLRISRHAILGFAIFVVTGACLCQVQTVFFQDWNRDFVMSRPGGGVGLVLGEKLLKGFIGGIGAFLLLTMAYLTGIIMMTGMHPATVLAAFREELPLGMGRLRGWLDERRGITSTESTTKKKAAKKKAKKATTEDADDGVAEPVTAVAEEADADPELPLEDVPEPKIIDASAPRLDSERPKKKTLAELREELQAKKKKRPVTNNPERTLAEAFSDYDLPPMDILQFAKGLDEETSAKDKKVLWETQTTIVKTLQTFGVKVSPGDITKGPTITRYEVYPSEGLRVNRITALEDDIARATRAESINILAPIPGRETVGIEISNQSKVTVTLRELLEDDAFAKTDAKIPLALGKDVYGNTIVGDLAAMPHLLVSGATGAGKSVCINSIIASLLYRFSPEELRFIMVDPKVVEMQAYSALPHLAIPLVTEPKKVLLALRWVVKEMENRYQLFKRTGCKDHGSFNAQREKDLAAQAEEKAADQAAEKSSLEPETPTGAGDEDDLGFEFDDGLDNASSDDPARTPSSLGATPGPVELDEAALSAHPVRVNSDGAEDYAPPPARNPIDEEPIPDSLPYIVVIIDELADLMDTAPADVETAIVRIAQMARAAGIHLILATQTPRAEVITGRIRANVPTKIAFRVSSALESRVILDDKGAERLVGKGDMLYRPPGTQTLTRAQGALVTEDEIADLVAYATEQGAPIFESEITGAIEGDGFEDEGDEVSEEDEETLEKCLEVIHQEGKASASMLQRRLRLGYNRASRMMDIMEARGIIGPGDGAKPREILVDLENSLD